MPFPGLTTFPGAGTFPGSLDITATPRAAGTPCPNVLLDLIGLSGTRLSVWRSAAGRRVPVRGFKRREVVGDSYTLVDYEAPFGIPISYDIECRNDAGVLLDTIALPVSVSLDVTVPWIQDALSPSVSMAVTLGGDSLTNRSLRRDGGLVPVNGATEPIGQGGVRRVGAGIPLSFRCSGEAEEDAIVAVLNSADPLVLRTPPGYRNMPRLAYVTTGEWNVNVPPQGGGIDAHSLITGTVDLVAAPSASVIVPVRTYGSVHESNTDYQAVRDAGSYLAVLRG